jgi:hypothetical protein
MRWLYSAGALLLSLSAASASGFSTDGGLSQSSTVTLNQQQLVGNLNARYQSVVDACAGGTPSYYCSGVMLRTATYSAIYPFWTHSPAAAALQSVTFSYIRRDIGNNGSDLGSGFIFSNQEASVAQNKAPVVRCIYPFMAGTQGQGRPAFGCGFRSGSTAVKQGGDPSTCATLVIPAVTAKLWLENYRRFGSVRGNQCSLSTTVAAQFKASLEAHNGVNAAHTVLRNELLIGTWPENAPERLPIEAFFYNGATGGLSNAQFLRRAYYRKTSQRVPIVRVNFAAADRNIFSLNETDQVDGWDVADRLNARYANTANDCAGKAAYYCNGVIMRTVEANNTFHVWNPSPGSVQRGGVSASYIRKDVGTTVFAWNYTQGIIFKDWGSMVAANNYPLALLCIYPSDAATFYRVNKGCGSHRNYPTASRSCSEVGVRSLAQWISFYRSVPGSGHFSARNEHQCSFGVDPASFALGIEVRKHFERPAEERPYHNELMIATWPQNIPDRLSIEAFFYHLDQRRAVGAEGGKLMQRDYFQTTKKIMPVIRVNMAAGASEVFSYSPADQGV